MADHPLPAFARSTGGPASVSRLEKVFDGLTDLATRLEIAVRIEPFQLRMTGKGGVCKISGQFVVLIDEKLPLIDRVGVLAEALGKLLPSPEMGDVEISGDLRPYLQTGHAGIAALLRPRPLARGRR